MSDLETMANKHGFSLAAVQAVAEALRQGHGTSAQFSHPDLGGMGQWLKGGMLMIGDPFNHALKARVAALIDDLAGLPRTPAPAREVVPRAAWWPAELGTPSSTGAQNDIRFAYFRDRERLVIEDKGTLSIYDTHGLAIHGIGQQQGSGQGEIVLSTSGGPVRLSELPRVGSNG
jgi:hypothetical protein